jgi:uncharacterized protein DUF2784
MVYRLLAVCLLLLVFVVAGRCLILWRPSLRWIHLPAVTWGAHIEFTGRICSLTPWEQALRLKGGQVGYAGEFIDYYILPILYPQGLTPSVQIAQRLLVIGVNVGIYALVGYRRASAIKRRGTRWA